MKTRIIKTIITTFILIIIFFTYYYFHKVYDFGIPCLFHLITGFNCPGCGVTRMLFSLVQGDIKTAFSYNQFLFILLPFILIYIIYKVYLYILDKEDKIIRKIPNYIWYILLTLTILWGIVRNISYFKF